MFVWMDEWFKCIWIVFYQEVYGFNIGGEIIFICQLWYNEILLEQCFGFLVFEQKEIFGFVLFSIDQLLGLVSFVRVIYDEGFLYVEINMVVDLLLIDEFMVVFDIYFGNIGEFMLLNGVIIGNRVEFFFIFVFDDDMVLYYVMEVYDMNGLMVCFNFIDLVQKFKSIIIDGVLWKVMRWINDGFEFIYQDIGKVLFEYVFFFIGGDRVVVFWNGWKIIIRFLWIMFYFYDLIQMMVNDGVILYDGGYNFEIIIVQFDGIVILVWYNGVVINVINRYSWLKWLMVLQIVEREKVLFYIIEEGFFMILDYVEQLINLVIGSISWQFEILVKLED